MKLQKDWQDPELIKAIRHQVCDEIREAIIYYPVSVLDEAGNVIENVWGIKMKDVNKLLDQIKKENKQ